MWGGIARNGSVKSGLEIVWIGKWWRRLVFRVLRRVKIAATLSNLGEALRAQGDLSRAAALLEDSLARYKELGEREGIAAALNNLGDLVQEQGDLKRAATLRRAGIIFAREGGAKWALLNHLEGAADLAYDLGRATQAARLFALSMQLREKMQMSRSLGNQTRYESKVTLVRESLGEAAFATEWEAGRAKT